MERLNEIHTMEDEEPESKEFQYQLPAAFARRLVGGKATSGFPGAEETYAQTSLVEAPAYFMDNQILEDSLTSQVLCDSEVLSTGKDLGWAPLFTSKRCWIIARWR